MTIALAGVLGEWTNFGTDVSPSYTASAGNQFIVFTAVGSPNSGIGITGTLSSPFNKQTPPGDYDDTFGDLAGIFYCPSLTAGSQTFTITATTAVQLFGWGYEFSGVTSLTGGAGTSVPAGATGTGGIRGASFTVPTGSTLLAFCADGVSGTGTISSPTGTNIDSGPAYCVTAYAGTGASIIPSFTGSQAAADGYFILAIILNPVASSATFSALSGSYSIAGRAATLSSILNLSASAGSYAMLGEPIGLNPVSTQLLMLANSGTFNYVLSPALSDHGININFGMFSYTGEQVSLNTISSLSLVAASGSYLISGMQLNLIAILPTTNLVPSVVGLQVIKAIQILNAAELLVGPLVYTHVAQGSPATLDSHVISQSIPAGTIIIPGETVILTVNSPPKGFPAVNTNQVIPYWYFQQ